MKVFFVAYEEANVGSIAPVMQALARDRSWEPVFVPGFDFKDHRAGVAEATAPPHVAARSLRAELGSDEIDGARTDGQVLLGRVLEWAEAVGAGTDGERRGIGAALQRLFARADMPDVFAAYAMVERGLEAFVGREQPTLVVLQEDTDYLRGRLAARLLRNSGATVVCMVPWYHNAILSYPVIGERLAGRYLVGTHGYAARLEAAGVPAARIEVVGNPVFDALPAHTDPPPARGRLLYALQGIPWEREIVSDLVDIVPQVRGATLRIKPHPQLPHPEWLGAMTASPGVALADRDADKAALIRSATCVIGQTSRMLYEASLAGRPVIIVHYDATPLPLDLSAADQDAVVARTKEALRHKVELVLAGQGRGLTCETIAPYHPRATERVIRALEMERESIERALPRRDGATRR